MSAATFRFYGELESFLPREQRGVAFLHSYARAATLKQAIESLGVPHTEIGRLLVNDQPATLARTVRDNDCVEAFPHEPGSAPFEEPLAFVADAHLGGLARMLRMLGFDSLYDNNLQDAQIVALVAAERRVVLTRDLELLKRKEVLRGCYVHALKPEQQLREVAARYALVERIRAFSLCLHCNLPLEEATADLVVHRVPERIRLHYTRFMHCAGCDRVYWQGSHWSRMREVLAGALGVPLADMG
jgi:uncharacterized protein with PIN domain